MEIWCFKTKEIARPQISRILVHKKAMRDVRASLVWMESFAIIHSFWEIKTSKKQQKEQNAVFAVVVIMIYSRM